MVGVIINILLVITFFLLGHIIQAAKKLFSIITDLFLKFLNLFGIRIRKREKHLKQSKEFKETYKEIRVVKLSKKNIKQKSSIDIIGLITLAIGLTLFLANIASGNAITTWLFNITHGVFGLLKSVVDFGTFYTAFLFSVMSFSISRVLNRWKETKQQRIEAKEAKLKKEAIEIMSSKELADAAVKKDKTKYEELKK